MKPETRLYAIYGALAFQIATASIFTSLWSSKGFSAVTSFWNFAAITMVAFTAYTVGIETENRNYSETGGENR